MSVIDCCRNLKKLEFSEFQLVTDDMLKQVSESCPELLDLNINSKWKITDKGFCNVAEKCLFLQKLDVSGTRLTNKSFAMIGENLKHLKHLKMRRCDHLTDESVSIIVHHIPDLLTLDIGWCNQLTKETLNAIAKKAWFTNACTGSIITDLIWCADATLDRTGRLAKTIISI